LLSNVVDFSIQTPAKRSFLPLSIGTRNKIVIPFPLLHWRFARPPKNYRIERLKEYLSQATGMDLLVSTSCVWNDKQKKGNSLEWSQQEFIEQGLKQHETVLEEHEWVPSTPNQRPDFLETTEEPTVEELLLPESVQEENE
jgi:hypothetical protein